MSKNYIKEYYEKIVKGDIVTSKRVKAVYKGLVYDIENPGKYHFDEKKALRPIEFIERFCKQSKGEWSGKPIKLELFQKAFISALFGFVDSKGLRRYKETFFLVGRKNGKSTLLSGISLYMLVADKEPGSEVYSIATKKDQAKIIFNEALNMVKQSPELRKLLKKRKTDLYFPNTMSKFEPLGKNSDSLDGLNSHMVVMDELHAVKDRNLYEVMKQSMSARRQPLMVMITTSGTVQGCIYDDMYEYASKVADGIIKDNTFLSIMYELDNKEEWRDPKAWAKANPSLGRIKKLSDIEEKVKRAKVDPKTLSGVLCKDFNIKQTLNSAWLTYDQLNNMETFNLEAFKGSYAIFGADLSKTLDLTSVTMLIPGRKKNYVEQMYWLPKDNFNEHIKDGHIPYDKWHEMGLLRLCEGNQINYSDITSWILEMVNTYEITPLWVYYDSWSASYWVEEMQSYGFNMVKCIQGMKTLSLPLDRLEADLEANKVVYNNNPLLKWCLSNTEVKMDVNGNRQPIKGSNKRMKIDGTASLLNCYVGLNEHLNDIEQGGLLYED